MHLPRTLLLSGFEPFGGDLFNPSGSIARELDGHRPAAGVIIRSLTLPVSGPPAWQKLARAIRRIEPYWIVAMGVSGRPEISWETSAWNEDNYRIPDNAGRQPRGAPILSGGPGKLESGLRPMPRLTENRPAALPLRFSTDPGRYVCNHLYYRLLHLTKNPALSAHGRTLFLHLPCTPEMRRGPDDARFFHPLGELSEILRALFAGMIEESNVLSEPGTTPSFVPDLKD